MSTLPVKTPDELSAYPPEEIVNMYNDCVAGKDCDGCPLKATEDCHHVLFKFIGEYAKHLVFRNNVLEQNLFEKDASFEDFYKKIILMLKDDLTKIIEEEFSKKIRESGTVTAYQISSAVRNRIENYEWH